MIALLSEWLAQSNYSSIYTIKHSSNNSNLSTANNNTLKPSSPKTVKP